MGVRRLGVAWQPLDGRGWAFPRARGNLSKRASLTADFFHVEGRQP